MSHPTTSLYEQLLAEDVVQISEPARELASLYLRVAYLEALFKRATGRTPDEYEQMLLDVRRGL